MRTHLHPLAPALATLLLAGLPACGSEERPASEPKPAPPISAERAPVPVAVPAETAEPEAPEASEQAPPVVEPAPAPKPAPAPVPAAAAGGSGRLVARVLYGGDLPVQLPKLTIDPATAAGCDQHSGSIDTTDRSIVVSATGEVAFAVVSLEGAGLVLDGADVLVEVDQLGCRFEPHVSVAPVGARVRFANSDPINHNVHAYTKKSKIPNANVAPGGESTFVLAGDEVFKVGCDIHPWMASYLFVADTPFAAVSDTTGRVTFEGVPAGSYKLKVWHEKLQKAGGGRGRTSSSVTVEIRGDETTEVELRLVP